MRDGSRWQARIAGCDARARKAESEIRKLQTKIEQLMTRQEHWLREKRQAFALAAGG